MNSRWVKAGNSIKKAVLGFLLLAWGIPLFGTNACFGASGIEGLKSLIGNNDSLLVADPNGRIIISKNENKKLIPASILKIFTSLCAIHYLGIDYRFQTEFFIGNNSNLKIKGFGDPFLVSEIVNDISRLLAALIGRAMVVNNLIIDDSFFRQPLTIPGISSSSQPYDAPNGALCVNFNTVFFKRTKSGYISAEPQTPLLPYAKKKIEKSKHNSGRIILSHVRDENTLYAGKLFQHFLRRHGVQFSGAVKLGRVKEAGDKLIYRYVSRFELEQLVSKLLEHSNNFTTNQLLIATGAEAYGPPGDLKKGVAAGMDYATDVLQVDDMTIVEGSGISRMNRVSARHMLRVLEKFEPYHRLMRHKGREYYKTGTLNGIKTRAGYVGSENAGLYRYVVMINTPGKSTTSIIQKLLRILE
ncbi:MAG: D-alanyl-D-alanine carboxypeptidase [Desulfobacterales bacterium]|nr:D-alanyl-D-alanine carboxypeptidase [Desulfobacterales bacterium]